METEYNSFVKFNEIIELDEKKETILKRRRQLSNLSSYIYTEWCTTPSFTGSVVLGLGIDESGKVYQNESKEMNFWILSYYFPEENVFALIFVDGSILYDRLGYQVKISADGLLPSGNVPRDNILPIIRAGQELYRSETAFVEQEKRFMSEKPWRTILGLTPLKAYEKLKSLGWAEKTESELM